MPDDGDTQRQIKELLRGKLVGGKVLLQDCKLVDENSRKSPAYSDPLYAPFYYHLGKFLCPKSVLTLGFTLGLLERCFFESCKTVERFAVLRVPDPGVYYSPRMGLYNVGRSYKGPVEYHEGSLREDSGTSAVSSGRWGVVFVFEETRFDDALYSMESMWGHLEPGGSMVVENVEDLKPVKKAFHAFADSVGRTPNVFATRYGTGVLRR